MMSEQQEQQDTSSTVSAKPGWLRALPVLVLIAAVVAQAGLMWTVNADRQSGSGFAMFSSVDFAGSRAISAQGSVDGIQVDVQLPASASDDIDQLLITPTHGRAEDLAQQLQDMRWNIDDRTASAGGDVLIESVTVTVRGLTASGHRLGSEILARGITQ